MSITPIVAAELPTLDLAGAALTDPEMTGTFLPVTGPATRAARTVAVPTELGTIHLEPATVGHLVRPLPGPLTPESDLIGDDGTVDVAVALPLDTLEGDPEDAMDAISVAVVGNVLLTGFSYSPLGVLAGQLVLRVVGDTRDAFAQD